MTGLDGLNSSCSTEETLKHFDTVRKVKSAFGQILILPGLRLKIYKKIYEKEEKNTNSTPIPYFHNQLDKKKSPVRQRHVLNQTYGAGLKKSHQKYMKHMQTLCSSIVNEQGKRQMVEKRICQGEYNSNIKHNLPGHTDQICH